MDTRCGCGSGVAFFGGNCTILFFILVFLLLFWHGNGFGAGVIDP
ncbi:MAG TPA: hypothetical protein VF941_06850 [Clostridia bacterium]